MSGLNRIRLLPARDHVASALREAILTHQFEEGQKDIMTQNQRLIRLDGLKRR